MMLTLSSVPSAVSSAVNKPAVTRWKPPADYKKLGPSDMPEDNPFSAANLRDKELWFIAAPAHVPISSLEKICGEDVNADKPILRHKGRNYCLEMDDEASTGLTILLPGSDALYRTGITHISGIGMG